MKKPPMKPGDLHLVTNGRDNTEKMYDHNHKLVQINGKDKIECHPHGWAGANQRATGGDTIEQLWYLGQPQWTLDHEDILKVKRPYGPVFMNMEDDEGKESQYGRDGIGRHGEGEYDGTFRDYQPLRDTSGCVRNHNADVRWIAHKVEALHKTGNRIWNTVDQPGGEGQV